MKETERPENRADFHYEQLVSFYFSTNGNQGENLDVERKISEETWNPVIWRSIETKNVSLWTRIFQLWFESHCNSNSWCFSRLSGEADSRKLRWTIKSSSTRIFRKKVEIVENEVRRVFLFVEEKKNLFAVWAFTLLILLSKTGFRDCTNCSIWRFWRFG